MTPADLRAALDRADREALAWTATGGTGLPPLVADVRALVDAVRRLRALLQAAELAEAYRSDDVEVERLRARLAEVEALRAEEQGWPGGGR